MGVKVKGGMWCGTCERPVAGQKSTKKVASLGKLVGTGGMYVPVPQSYHCPACGCPVGPLAALAKAPAATRSHVKRPTRTAPPRAAGTTNLLTRDIPGLGVGLAVLAVAGLLALIIASYALGWNSQNLPAGTP